MRTVSLLLALVPLLAACQGTTGARRPVPREAEANVADAFFRAPALSHLRLSPDGSQIAGIHTTRDGVQTLIVRPTRGGALRFLAKLEEPGQRIAMLGWPGDDHLLVSIEMRSQTAGGEDDVTDAARWLIEQRIADPRRIGIYGASYGGYAALMALAREPELFAAGASFAGVTDLITMLNDDEWYLFDDWNRPTVGAGWGDRKQLQETSPAQQADRIRAPVLIAHGTDDPMVHVKHAELMAEALEDRDKPVETYLYPGEVHGFIDARNEVDFYARLGAFFSRHLPPGAPVASGAAPGPSGTRGPD